MVVVVVVGGGEEGGEVGVVADEGGEDVYAPG